MAPWSKVVGRKARLGLGPSDGSSPRTPSDFRSAVSRSRFGRRTETFDRGTGRVPRTPAIRIKSLEDGVADVEMVRKVRSKVSPKDFDIKNVRVREAVGGGVLLEVLDPDATLDRVDALAGAIGAALSGCSNVSRPARRAEFRLKGLDPSVSVDEIRESVAKAGGCSVSAVSVSGVRRLTGGHRVAWVSCPTTVAHRLSASGCLAVGWSSALIDLVHLKRVQCYRCWQFGHVRGACKATVDRTGHCLRCGQAGHAAEECTNDLSCVLCRDCGLDHAHRMGSRLCKSTGQSPIAGRMNS